MRKNHSCQAYSFTATSSEDSIHLSMSVNPLYISTTSLIHTHQFLKTHLPTVLQTICFNKNSLPFSEEVRHTHFAHMFEHVFLEYLCLLKMANGETDVRCDGRTLWNWKKDAYGTFLIEIKTNRTDSLLFSIALEKTVELCEGLLTYEEIQPSYLTLHPER